MRFSDFLAQEWRPALGCTEPASIAWATAVAASVAGAPAEQVSVVCDPRLYKNCYAVGIPNSDGKTGVLWTAALGAEIADPLAKLEIFRKLDQDAIERARQLVDAGKIAVKVDAAHTELFAECRVRGPNGEARAVVADDHSNIVKVELNGEPCELPAGAVGASTADQVRKELASRSLSELFDMAWTLEAGDRELLEQGTIMNEKIAEHGVELLGKGVGNVPYGAIGGRAAQLVSGGVFARMSGVDQTVMTLAGSGNKGITASVPMVVRARELGSERPRAEAALALACLLTSATTHHLGALSAICGSANAAGIGLAGGLVLLEGGTAEQVSLAVSNIVGNLTGMICDGAKIGCAMKCMTGVDAAFRAAYFARHDIGIPETDGIVGATGEESLAHLARISGPGMQAVETEILAIMQQKLDRAAGGKVAD